MPTDNQQNTSRPDRHHPNASELEEEREALIQNVGAQITQAICTRTHELGSHYVGVLGAIRDLYHLPPGPKRDEAWRAAEYGLNRMSGAYGRELVGATLEVACSWIDLDQLARENVQVCHPHDGNDGAA